VIQLLRILLAPVRKSLERGGRRLFAEPGRAMSPSVDALADQAIVKVICLVDHAGW
jgi:hypothetical protein